MTATSATGSRLFRTRAARSSPWPAPNGWWQAGRLSGPPALRAALIQGWCAVLAGQGNLAHLRHEFDTRPGLDDEVAAVAYALQAADGSPDAAWWAASRGMDAAFETVAGSEAAGEFRALDIDAAEPVVRAELKWQQAVLDQLEQRGPTEELVSRLRS